MLISFSFLPSCLSSILNLLVLMPLLCMCDFLHVWQVYIMFVFLVDFVFLFHLLIAGFDHLPKLPKPLHLPLNLALSFEPRFNAPLFLPDDTSAILCSV